MDNDGMEKDYFGVTVKENPSAKFFAHTNFWGRIEISSELRAKLSDNALKTIIMHERYHQRLIKSKLGKFVAVASATVFFLTIPALIILGIALTITKFRLYDLAIVVVFSILVISTAVYVLMSFERSADLYSAKELGKENWIRGMRETGEVFGFFKPKRSLKLYINNLRHYGSWSARISFVEKM